MADNEKERTFDDFEVYVKVGENEARVTIPLNSRSQIGMKDGDGTGAAALKIAERLTKLLTEAREDKKKIGL